MKNDLYKVEEIKIEDISSSNLIYFEDYSKIYIKLHYEFIRKYILYKILKSNNYNESQFLTLVEKIYPYYLPIAKELFPDKSETINYFKANTDESEETLNKIFEVDDNILNDNISSYIKNYTTESFYYRYLNKFLREKNFEAFRILSSHISKFILKLYDYRKKIISKQKKGNLYRYMYLNPNDIKLYENSVGRVICYPAFTSTTINIKKNFKPKKYNPNDELVFLEIKYNNTKSNVMISEFSKFPQEEEILFLPFSFFKVNKVELNSGDEKKPHKIYLIAINSEKSIEEMFENFFKKETDNLSPEGLDFFILENDNTKIIFNPIFLEEEEVGCSCCQIF